jgi:hypothetical protein
MICVIDDLRASVSVVDLFNRNLRTLVLGSNELVSIPHGILYILLRL